MSDQFALDLPPPAERFDGETYSAEQDCARLTGQLLRCFELMSDGKWWTIRELADIAECSDQSASARIRDLRKPKFGGHIVDRRRCDENDLRHGYRKGTHFYRLTVRAA